MPVSKQIFIVCAAFVGLSSAHASAEPEPSAAPTPPTAPATVPAASGFYVYPSVAPAGAPVPASAVDPTQSSAVPERIPGLPVRQPVSAAPNWKSFVDGFQHDPVLKTIDALPAATGWTTEPAQLTLETSAGLATTSGASAASPNGFQNSWLQEYGCTHIWTKTFQRTQRAAYVNVYSFKTAEGAFGAYSTMRVGSSNVIIRGAASSEDENSISFWKGKRFIVLTSRADEDDVSKVLLTSLANRLDSEIDETSIKPGLIASMPVWDRVPGSEKLFMGPEAAKRSVHIPQLQALSIERSKGAAFAEYKFPAPLLDRMKALVIDYAEPTAARNTFNMYVGLLAVTHKMKPVEPNVQLCKLNDTYMLASLRGARVVIISGAHKKASPLVLARQLAY